MKKILIIDDDELFLKMLGRVFSCKGYKPLLAKNHVEAMDKFYSDHLEVVLSDVELNQKEERSKIFDGIKCMAPWIKYYFMSGRDYEEAENFLTERERKGMKRFFQKPINLESMFSEIDKNYL